MSVLQSCSFLQRIYATQPQNRRSNKNYTSLFYKAKLNHNTTKKQIGSKVYQSSVIDSNRVLTGIQDEQHEQNFTKNKQLLNKTQKIIVLILLAISATILSTCFKPQAVLAVGQAANQHIQQKSGLISGMLHNIIHVDKYLETLIREHGNRIYQILFVIIFAETGFVLTPFLPGDSLLFAVGALSATGKLVFNTSVATILAAAILGDFVNYSIGYFLGQKALESRFISQKYIDQTNKYYLKYGGKTIVLARFVPIVRTFAPFVAGVGRMPYQNFWIYNVFGAILWTFSFTLLGKLFGNLPIVKEKFTLVVLGIVLVSVLPVVYEVLKGKGDDQAPGGSQFLDNSSGGTTKLVR